MVDAMPADRLETVDSTERTPLRRRDRVLHFGKRVLHKVGV